MYLPSYNLREKLLEQNSIKSTVEEYKKNSHIQEFDKELWHKISNTDVFFLRDFTEVFEEGLNIGTCGLTTRYLSFLFDDFQIVTGKCEFLKGTKGAQNGEHTWLESGSQIYDTTLLFKMDKEIGYNLFGYASEEIETSQELLKNQMYVLQRRIAKNRGNVIWKKDLIKQFKDNHYFDDDGLGF